MRVSRLVVSFLTVVFVVAIIIFALRPRTEPQVRARTIDLSDLNAAAGFARAFGPRPLTFPADHGAHPDFQTEWWYYTGNLISSDGRHFGYQLTFFRRALVPAFARVHRQSTWGTNQVYLAHFAVTDVTGKHHHTLERFSRGAVGLAGAGASPFRVWLEDWQVVEEGSDVYRLYAAQSEIEIDLQLKDVKGPILQGDQGFSQKGPGAGNASYYYSLTRLITQGTVRLDQDVFAVSGTSWMDHEFSTSALGANQVGWDWFSLQMDDGSEMMAFQVRQTDGSIDPFSSGTLVLSDGRAIQLKKDAFNITVQKEWSSPHTGAVYPASWTVSVPQAQLNLEITPYLADQELNLSYSYWEGAVRIMGERAGKSVTGVGYVELTGYAGSMQRQF
jgi:predicted secreted hydrolase